MSNAPFPIDPVLTGITLAYRNTALISDGVLPRTLSLPKQEFKYNQWALGEGFTIQDTKVGRKSAPNEVEFSAISKTESTQDFGLDDFVPISDIENAGESLDPLGHASESLTDLVLLDREKRVADVVFAAATYPAANKKILSGISQWSDTASDPVKEVSDAIDVPVIRPNVMVVSQQVWTVLRRHEKIVQAAKAIGGTTAGLAAREAVAELFELEEILVGRAFQNTAKPGQTVTLARLWGKNCLLLFRDRLATTPMSNRITFGFTAEFGNRVSGQLPEPKRGLRGGITIRVGESLKEVIAANDVAFFIENAIA